MKGEESLVQIKDRLVKIELYITKLRRRSGRKVRVKEVEHFSFLFCSEGS